MTVSQVLMLVFGLIGLALTVSAIHPLVVEISYSQYEEVSRAAEMYPKLTSDLIRNIMSDHKITGWEYLQLMENINDSDFKGNLI